MNADFGCTQCGRCCHDLKLPLSVSEAMTWLRDGHDVQVLCEAVPWPDEPPASDLMAQHKRRRSFLGVSGSLPVRVAVTLAASFSGACPHLQADMRCGNYAGRPGVCRIYPAEIHPFIELQPASKACPDEAWQSGRPLIRGGLLVDSEVRESVERARAADEQDALAKGSLCASLGLDFASMANEGFVIHSPSRADLLSELCRDVGHVAAASAHARWQFVSNQRATVEALDSVGAIAQHSGDGTDSGFNYVGFRPVVG